MLVVIDASIPATKEYAKKLNNNNIIISGIIYPNLFIIPLFWIVFKTLDKSSDAATLSTAEIPLDEDAEFYLEYKNKVYRKVSIIDYDKCIKIVGERYHLWI